MSLVLRDGRAATARPAPRLTPEQLQRGRQLTALRMRHDGRAVIDIAKFLGVTRQTVYNWLRGVPAEAAKMAVFN